MVLLNEEGYRRSTYNERGDTNDEKNNWNERNSGIEDEQNRSQNQFNTSTVNPNAEDIYEMLLNLLKQLGLKVKRVFQYIVVDLEANKIIDQLMQWCVQHPQKAKCLVVAVLVISFPVLLFMGFALSTIAMTLTGFLVLEGTLLTTLTMILFGLLGALVIIMLFFAIIAAATYFGVSFVYERYENMGTRKKNVENMRNNT